MAIGDVMTMDQTETAAPPRRLAVEWREQSGPLTVVFFRQKPARIRICGTGMRFCRRGFDPARGLRAFRGRSQARRRRSPGGFTLLELLVVLTIIGLMASLTLPHLRGFSKSNSMNAATRQMLDDISYARQRAIANRSTVYMVFVPPAPWNYISEQAITTVSGASLSNLVASQYRGYALVSLRTVGDQPGQWHPSFLTDWKTLPSGVFIATNEFVGTNVLQKVFSYFTTNTLAPPPNIPNDFTVYTFPNSSSHLLPFPNLQNSIIGLPYIAFSPNGSLVDENGNIVQDQYIPLTSGGILYPSDDKGYLFQAPLITENPVGESSNNPNLIHIDSTTARAHLERNQF